jgi:hypothetical protein
MHIDPTTYPAQPRCSLEPVIKPLVLQSEPDNVDRIWLLSVRHSGTHYMYKPLECMGYEQCIVHWDSLKQKHPTGPRQFIHAHIDIGAEYLKYLNTEKVIMPLRNPVECYRTHVYRYLRGVRSASEVVPTILYAYKELRRVWHEKNSFVFRVDQGDQQHQWTQLHNFLNATQGLAYKAQPNNVATNRKFPVTQEHGYTEEQERLFANPPDEIWKLAEDFGY